MLTLAMKTLIILLGISGTPAVFGHTTTFIFLLLAITATALSQYYQIKKWTLVLAGCYSLLSLFYPVAALFLPVFFFDLAVHFSYKYTFSLLFIFIITNSGNTQTMFFHLFIGLIALFLAHMSLRIAKLDVINKEIRDTNMLQKKSLIMKNQEVLERQNDEIHMTKLKERNRIARDIHDTIGHSLSRALLQTGALAAMNQNKTLQPAINDLKETLTTSMNSIRNSIHDLKDDSVDLQAALSQILTESGFTSTFVYDVTSVVPNAVKNCFLIILKESLTNTRKHSDAKSISLRLIEHPAIYQFLVADDGTKAPFSTGRGIGLQNIQERVSELNGYCKITYQNGFRIFITIPKEMNEP